MSKEQNVAIGVVPNCPHCGVQLEEAVESYTVPGQIGPASEYKEDCYECDQTFSVEKISDTECVVRAI
ncbi:hypothetical protein HNP46_000479 [Pseudomonas nitritireducens]|uniref:CPXCG motif-containing cysteine-rich protein n=1 Tax=Pseudomonas nitroreducens TaxID=46680 RepID=A0A7W7NYF3_PSENT|nr:hypothetical protein [Pseudomonas nitritireducens]MBB4861668.1 hypothetical protein [Pseudomonas nitritireducens]